MVRTKAILWDVYGTLMAARRGDFSSLVHRETELRAAFQQTVGKFNLPVLAPRLHTEFLQAVAAERNARMAKGVRYPEIRVELVWLRLLQQHCRTDLLTIPFAREVALYFEERANPKRLMPEAFDTWSAARSRVLRQGICSNAQFYTLIELTELFRQESGGKVASIEVIVDPALTILSCELGVAKPDPVVFQNAITLLAAAGIKPEQCLFVGDSPDRDVAPAREAGFRAVLFDPAATTSSECVINHLSLVLDLL
jgi:FMN phosphatase YigB (HAD superfamily)